MLIRVLYVRIVCANFSGYCTFSFVQTNEKATKKKGCRLHLSGYRLVCSAKAQKLSSLRQSVLFHASQPAPCLRLPDDAGGCAMEKKFIG